MCACHSRLRKLLSYLNRAAHEDSVSLRRCRRALRDFDMLSANNLEETVLIKSTVGDNLKIFSKKKNTKEVNMRMLTATITV